MRASQSNRSGFETSASNSSKAFTAASQSNRSGFETQNDMFTRLDNARSQSNRSGFETVTGWRVFFKGIVSIQP